MPTLDRHLSYAEARSLLYRYATTDPKDEDGQFLFAFNQALERIYAEGIWNGVRQEVNLTGLVDTDTGIIQLPYEYEAMLAAQIEGTGAPIVVEEFEYIQSGPGEMTGSSGGSMVVDNGFVTNDDQQSVREYKFLPTITASTTIRGLLKRRFVFVERLTDSVIPSSVPALKNALLAINFEDQSDIERSQFYWNECRKILNEEKATSKVGAIRPLAANIFGLGEFKVTGMY